MCWRRSLIASVSFEGLPLCRGSQPWSSALFHRSQRSNRCTRTRQEGSSVRRNCFPGTNPIPVTKSSFRFPYVENIYGRFTDPWDWHLAPSVLRRRNSNYHWQALHSPTTPFRVLHHKRRCDIGDYVASVNGSNGLRAWATFSHPALSHLTW